MGLSDKTADMRECALGHFIAWVDERGIRHPGEVTRPILQRYQRHLYLLRKKDGKPLAYSSQVNRLTPVVAFFKWLTREGHILSNPAADLEGIRQGLAVLLAQEVQVPLVALQDGPCHFCRVAYAALVHPGDEVAQRPFAHISRLC